MEGVAHTCSRVLIQEAGNRDGSYMTGYKLQVNVRIK